MKAKRKVAPKRKSKKFALWLFLCGGLTAGGYLALPYLSCCFDNACVSLADISGFQIRHIDIKGATPKVAALVRQRLQVREGDMIFKLSAKEMHKNVCSVPWIKSAIVSKNLPNFVSVQVGQKEPIAVFQKDGVSSLIDANGDLIETVFEKPRGLPLVAGANANRCVSRMLDIIAKYPDLRHRLDALVFVQERRWDITVSGLKIMLPDRNTEKTLEVLAKLLDNGRINKNTANYIDMRIYNRVIINGLNISIDKKNAV